MRRPELYPYFFLGAFLFFWMQLAPPAVDWMRGGVASSLAPFGSIGKKVLARPAKDPLWLLQEENRQLRLDLEALRGQLESDAFLQKQWESIQALHLEAQQTLDVAFRAFLQRREQEIRSLIESHLTSCPARVICRDPTLWSSSFWIDVGEAENQKRGQRVVAKNSPVVLGDALVGLVEYVGYMQSRVRLLTDSGLCPSVRAVRGSKQNQNLASSLENLQKDLEIREDLFENLEEKHRVLGCLQGLRKRMQVKGQEAYLAKGELHGKNVPFWRAGGALLQGMGFNFDYSDAEGSARDLRTGKSVGGKGRQEPILQVGDLLVTSGLDGVFPPALRVGVVTRIAPLQEGSFSYELEAKPCCLELNYLERVSILPPLDSE